METLSIKGDHANFDEGLLALKKGAMVTGASFNPPGRSKYMAGPQLKVKT